MSYKVTVWGPAGSTPPAARGWQGPGRWRPRAGAAPRGERRARRRPEGRSPGGRCFEGQYWGGEALGRARRGGAAHHGADLAVLRGHAVPVVQVGEGLGGPPRLQVPRHAHGRPHLGPVERVARSEQVLRAPSLSLGAGNRASPPRATGARLLPPPDSAPSRSFSDGADSSRAAPSLSMALPHSPATSRAIFSRQQKSGPIALLRRSFIK